MADVKFNVYYSTTASGPWTLANPTPLDHIDGVANEYLVSGLMQDTTYYFSIVGGVMDGVDFVPLVEQAITPNSEGAGGVEKKNVPLLAVQAYVPRVSVNDGFGMQFEISGIVP